MGSSPGPPSRTAREPSGAADELARNPDVQEFYLGGGHAVDYQSVKHYRRRKRWLT